MKKLIAIIIVAVLALSLVSCVSIKIEKDDGTKTESTKETKAPKETKAETEPETEPETDEPETDEPETDEPDDDIITIGRVYFSLPAGFKTMTSNGILYVVPDDYPVHSDNAACTINNDSFNDYPDDDIIEMFREAFGDSIKDISIYRDKIDSIEYIAVSYLFDIGTGDYYEQYNCSFFFDDETVNIALTSVTGEKIDELNYILGTIGIAD